MATVQEQIVTDFKDGLEIRQACFPDKIRSNTLFLFCHGVAHHANFFDEWSNHLALNDGIRAAAVSYTGHGNSIQAASLNDLNALSVSDYEADVLKALEHCGEQAQEIVCVGHSMGARVLYNLTHQKKLPETVKGVVLLNPVPHSGMLASCTVATLRDMAMNFRATPFSFPYALYIHRDIERYFKSNPDRMLSVFFSSDSEKRSRLSGMNAQQFCDQFLCAESAQVVNEVLFPTQVKPQAVDVPLLIVGSRNDRIISHRDLFKMERFMRRHGYYGSTLNMHRDLSHDTPLDKNGLWALESILTWMKENSLLRNWPPSGPRDFTNYSNLT